MGSQPIIVQIAEEYFELHFRSIANRASFDARVFFVESYESWRVTIIVMSELLLKSRISL